MSLHKLNAPNAYEHKYVGPRQPRPNIQRLICDLERAANFVYLLLCSEQSSELLWRGQNDQNRGLQLELITNAVACHEGEIN